MADEEKSPTDQLMDLFFYAPLGLALTVRESLPDLVEKGRERFTTQAAMARMIGEFGVKQAGSEMRKRLDDVTELLSELGVFPGARTAPTAPPPSAASAEPSAPSTNGRAASPAEPAEPPAPRPDGSALAIPGYDTLSASQVVQRLAGLSADELEAVRAYEEATRGRRTILSKITQLQSQSQ